MFANSAAISSGLNVLFGSDESGIGCVLSAGASVFSATVGFSITSGAGS